MKAALLLTPFACWLTGCAMFEAPRHSAKDPTLPTGQYNSAAEKWADETLAARRHAAKEETQKQLERLPRS